MEYKDFTELSFTFDLSIDFMYQASFIIKTNPNIVLVAIGSTNSVIFNNCKAHLADFVVC